jgi:hypothetical protein
VSELRTVLRVAYRHIDEETTLPSEREAVLAAMAAHLDNAEAELAAQTLHHLREQRRLQLTLKSVMEASR